MGAGGVVYIILYAVISYQPVSSVLLQMNVDAFSDLKQPAPLGLQCIHVSLEKKIKIQIIAHSFALDKCGEICPYLYFVRGRVVVFQKDVGFGFCFVQVLLFLLQGAHQFLLHNKSFSNLHR